MENLYSNEDLYLYVQNGGSLYFVKDYIGNIDVEEIPQIYINKRAEKGCSLSEFTKRQINQIPQNIVNKFAARSLNWFYLSDDQIKNIPQDIVNEYVEKGGDLFYLTDDQIKNVPQEYINKRAEKGCDLSLFSNNQIKNIPQDSVNKCAEKGYESDGFNMHQVANIPQDIINVSASKGGKLYHTTPNQIRAIPLQLWGLYVANGGNLTVFESDALKNENILDKIPQEYFNMRAENGHDMSKVSKHRILDIPQDCIDKCLEKNGYVNGFTDDQILSAKIISFNKYYANGNSIDYNDEINDKIISIISKEILKPTVAGQRALFLYATDKMKAKDLPADVFVNYNLRSNFLRILKIKTLNKFNQICEEKGYVNSVPPEIQKAFDEKLQSFYADVERRKEEGVQELVSKLEKEFDNLKSKEEKQKQETVKDINSWEM